MPGIHKGKQLLQKFIEFPPLIPMPDSMAVCAEHDAFRHFLFEPPQAGALCDEPGHVEVFLCRIHVMELKRCQMILAAVLTVKRLFVLPVPCSQFELLPFAPLDSFLLVRGIPNLFVILPMKLLALLRILKW